MKRELCSLMNTLLSFMTQNILMMKTGLYFWVIVSNLTHLLSVTALGKRKLRLE